MNEQQQGLLHRLQKPAGQVDVVIDTDTFNELDDQYALAYLIKSPEKLSLKAIYAAPFENEKAQSPADGMEKSYLEIMKVLSLLEREDLKPIVFKGSGRFLANETEPVYSPAAEHLADLAMNYTEEKPLYVIAIAAITNVASALLIRPEIRDRIVVVWLGGHSYDWFDNREFNARQDVAAARILFGCGAAVVQLPCMGVVSAFAASGPELEYWLKGKNKLCDYLLDVTAKEAAVRQGGALWSRPIWDVCAVAWLLDGRYMLDRLEHSPIPQYDHHYSFDKTRHFIRYVYYISRDRLFADLFAKLAR
jgi:inosine-uridine nucleoside N-ribohydrolase